jgi:hypothetical protein
MERVSQSCDSSLFESASCLTCTVNVLTRSVKHSFSLSGGLLGFVDERVEGITFVDERIEGITGSSE